ncbi:MAG: YdcF family protein, partial [Flavobacteriales bacterium]
KTGEKRFLLITSSAHIRRAQACFEKQGVSVQVYPAMKGVGNRRWQLDYLLVPSLDNFSKWRGLIHEWIGFLSYKVRGYV